MLYFKLSFIYYGIYNICMPVNEIKLTTYECECNRCNYKWRSVRIPLCCSRCKSPYWNTERTRKARKIVEKVPDKLNENNL